MRHKLHQLVPRILAVWLAASFHDQALAESHENSRKEHGITLAVSQLSNSEERGFFGYSWTYRYQPGRWGTVIEKSDLEGISHKSGFSELESIDYQTLAFSYRFDSVSATKQINPLLIVGGLRGRYSRSVSDELINLQDQVSFVSPYGALEIKAVYRQFSLMLRAGWYQVKGEFSKWNESFDFLQTETKMGVGYEF